MHVYSMDIGGSSVKHGIVEVDAESATIVDVPQLIPLPSLDFRDLRDLIFDAISVMTKSRPDIASIGISTTGSVDTSGKVVSAGHFNDYKNVDWAELIGSKFPQIRTVITVNDGRAFAWGEYSTDPIGGKSHIHAVVGTGVGGGIVHDGELLLGDSGQAGYIGHIKITTAPTPICSCGSMGCVEVLASGPAIVRYLSEKSEDSTLLGSDAFATIATRAQQGDELALAAFSSAGRWLGIGLGNAMNVLNPSVVSVGGGVVLASESITGADDGGPFFASVIEGVRQAAHRRVFASADIRPARLGNDGGMIGAALLAAHGA